MVVLAAVAAIGMFRPVQVVGEPPEPVSRVALVPELAEPVPERFAAWEPFVITFEVSGVAAGPTSPFDPAFGSRPCAALGRADCSVRLAWDGVSRWSLTASADATFDGADPRQLSAGGLFYGLEDRQVLGVLDTDRLPGLHLCHELAERRAGGEAVTAADAGAQVVVLQRRGWGAASCLGERGIPIGIDRGDSSWTMVELARRSPTDDEIGVHLVAGRAAFAPEPGCGRPGEAAPDWLLAAARKAGLAATATGGGIEFLVPGAWQRQACAWLAPSYLPVGARAHRLNDGTVVEELLHPRPMVSVAVGAERLWLAFTEEGAGARGVREREVFVLGEAVRRLLTDS